MTDLQNVHICWSRKDKEKVTKSYCPNCDKKTRFYGWFQEWYGWHETCLNCGDSWQDGELSPRPFARGWRKENIGIAKEAIKQMRREK